MLLTTFISVLEPRTPLWEESSVTWTMVRALKANKPLTLCDSQGNDIGRVQGAVPILQPLPAEANGTPGFLMVFRGVIQAPAPYAWKNCNTYLLFDENRQLLAKPSRCSYSEADYGVPLLIVAPQITSMSSADISAVQTFLGRIAQTFWTQEPINETTTSLHLAPSGQLATSLELRRSGTPVGCLRIAGGTAAIVPGIAARTVTYRKLRGAWNVRAFGESARGGSSSSSDCTGSSTGGDGDGDGGSC